MIEFTRYHEIAADALEAVREGRPYSLVRFGDGENSVIQYPEYCCEPRIQYVFRRALENRTYAPEEILSVKAGLMDSLANADAIGLYDSTHVNILCRIYGEHLADCPIPQTAKFCIPTIHFYLQQAGHLRAMIEAAEHVTLISGRDVLAKFKQEFAGKPVEMFSIPSENVYRLESEAKAISQPHYPDIFNKIHDGLEVKGTRHLFLVGGGFLGKIYCDLAKRRGGIAVDIGSVFDYWADVPTREGYMTVRNGQLELTRPGFRPAMGIDAVPVGEKASQAYEGNFDTLDVSNSPGGFLAEFQTTKLKRYAKWAGAPFDDGQLIRNYLPVGALVSWVLWTGVKFVASFDDEKVLEGVASTINYTARQFIVGYGQYLEAQKPSAVAIFTRLEALDSAKIKSLKQILQARPDEIFFSDFRVFDKLNQEHKALVDGYDVFDLKLVTGTDFGNHSGFLRLTRA